jgi:hypothetical protein
VGWVGGGGPWGWGVEGCVAAPPAAPSLRPSGDGGGGGEARARGVPLTLVSGPRRRQSGAWSMNLSGRPSGRAPKKGESPATSGAALEPSAHTAAAGRWGVGGAGARGEAGAARGRGLHTGGPRAGARAADAHLRRSGRRARRRRAARAAPRPARLCTATAPCRPATAPLQRARRRQRPGAGAPGEACAAGARAARGRAARRGAAGAAATRVGDPLAASEASQPRDHPRGRARTARGEQTSGLRWGWWVDGARVRWAAQTLLAIGPARIRTPGTCQMQAPGLERTPESVLQAWCDSKAHFIAPPKRKDDQAGAAPPTDPEGAPGAGAGGQRARAARAAERRCCRPPAAARCCCPLATRRRQQQQVVGRARRADRRGCGAAGARRSTPPWPHGIPPHRTAAAAAAAAAAASCRAGTPAALARGGQPAQRRPAAHRILQGARFKPCLSAVCDVRA